MTAASINKTKGRTRTQSIAYVALTTALLAVSAWVSIPLGPVPFTLQTFVLAFALLALRPSEAIAAVGIYLLLGGIGVPVFSGMRGGVGMLAGATGGFLWGFLLGAAAALLVRQVIPAKSDRAALVRDFAACLLFLLVTYVCGWAQLMAVAGMGPVEALLAGIAPFVLIDIAKLCAAVVVAHAVLRALPHMRKANQ